LQTELHQTVEKINALKKLHSSIHSLGLGIFIFLSLVQLVIASAVAQSASARKAIVS